MALKCMYHPVEVVISSKYVSIYFNTACWPISGPENGGVSFDRDPIGPNQRLPVGTRARFSCHDGFTRHGAGVSECRAGNSWVTQGRYTHCTGKIHIFFVGARPFLWSH